MISSIFGKTKPISHIVVLSFLFLFYWLVYFLLLEGNIFVGNVFLQFVYVSALLLAALLVNFIVSRNKLTGTNTYTLFYFSIFIIIFPIIIADGKGILCGLSILLSTRRIISLKSLSNVKNKIFDATLWIGIASLFCDWALLYLILVFITIWLYQPKKIRNWLVPFAALFSFYVLVYSILLLTRNQDYLESHYIFSFQYKKELLQDWQSHLAPVFFVFCSIIAICFSFLKLGKTGLGRILSHRLILISFVIGLLVLVLSEFRASLIILTFFPSAVFIANYVESISRPKIKEIVLLCSLIIPLIIAIIRFL